VSFSAITQRASASRGSSDFIAVTFSSGSVVVGKAAFVVVLSRNRATTNGASNTHTGLTSITATNTWVKLGEYTQTSGTISDGSCLSIWSSIITSQITAGADNLRMSFSGIVSRSIMYVFDASVGAGILGLSLAELGVGQNAYEASVSGLPSREYLLIGAMGGNSSDTTKTPDADYVERHDVTDQTDLTFAAHIQTRIATLTDDTCSSTDWTATNPLSLLAAVYEQSNSWNYYAQHRGA